MTDFILHATAKGGMVRAYCATTKHMVENARIIHNLTPVTSAVLGRTLTAAAIMGAMLKNDDDLLTVQIKCDGDIGGLVVTSDSRSNVKGYAYNPQLDLPLKQNGKLDVSGAIGKGTLSVVKDLGLKEPYIGQIPIVSGEIAEDFAYYYAMSEQIPSAIALGVLVDVDYTIKQSGGFFIQLMPGAEGKVIEELEQKIKEIDSITTLFELGLSPFDILNRVLGDVNITNKTETKYFCNCNRDRVHKALISIGIKDLTEILETDKQATLHCHFCNKEYLFNEDDIKNIIKEVVI